MDTSPNRGHVQDKGLSPRWERVGAATIWSARNPTFAIRTSTRRLFTMSDMARLIGDLRGCTCRQGMPESLVVKTLVWALRTASSYTGRMSQAHPADQDGQDAPILERGEQSASVKWHGRAAQVLYMVREIRQQQLAWAPIEVFRRRRQNVQVRAITEGKQPEMTATERWACG